MIREWRLFLTAVQFLTRVPVPAWVGHSPDQLDRAVRYFPLVGVGVGLLASVVYSLLWPHLGRPAAAVLSLAATLLATGAFHEDGLADSCDGLFGGWTRDDVLRIMKDSRIGTFGAAGLFVALALKVALLSGPTLGPAAIVAAHAGSRFAAVSLIAVLPYVRKSEQGAKAKPVAGAVDGPALLIAGLCGLVPMLILGTAALPAIVLGGIVTAGLALWFQRRLGGYTGDTLGATQQLVELTVLLAAAWHAG